MKEQINKLVKFADKDGVFSNVCVDGGEMIVQNRTCGAIYHVDYNYSFCCDAKKLNNIMNSCKNEYDLKTTDKSVIIKSGSFKSKAEVINVSEYPMINFDAPIWIPVGVGFLDRLKKLSKFADKDDVRVYFQGVNLTDDGYLEASNGHVVVREYIGVEMDNSVIIPITTIDKMDQEITDIFVDDKTIYFKFDGGLFFSRVIDTKYPDVKKVIKDMESETAIGLLEEPIKSIAKFCDHSGTVIIGSEISNRDKSTTIEGFDFPDCAFNVNYLLKLFDVGIESIDLDSFISGSISQFKGENITGAISGIKT